MSRRALAKTLAVDLLDMSGISLLLRPFYGGCGAVMALHRVLPEDQLVMEEGNSIGAQQLRDALHYLRQTGWEFIALDQLPDRLKSPKRPKFMAITLDDGYLDNLAYGLPIFREFEAPFTVFPATGFVSRTVVYTPIAAADLLQRATSLTLAHPTRGPIDYPARTREEKLLSFQKMCWDFSTAELQPAVAAAADRMGLTLSEVLDGHFMSWDQLRTLARDPLASIGVHTVNHAALAQLPEDKARWEIETARDELQTQLGVPIRHIAYPYGSPGACGEREFRIARELGFSTGYTTHRGNLHPRHRDELWSLPRHTLSMVKHSASVRYLRLSLNGIWDSPINGTLVSR